MADSRRGPRAAAVRAREGWDDLVRLFANVTFGVSLLAVWAFLTLIGVVIEQGKDPSFYAARRTRRRSRG